MLLSVAKCIVSTSQRVGVATTRRCYSTPTPPPAAFNIKEHRQFIVFGYDGKDEKALERRMAARGAHLEGAKKLKEDGKLLYGGAVLDRDGKMVASVMLMNDLTEDEVKAIIAADPYVKGKAWESYEIKPFRVAIQK